MSGRFPGWWICKACRLPNCSVAALTRNGILLPNHSDEIVQDLHLFPFYPLPLRPGAMQRHQSFYLVFRIIPKSIFWCNRLLPWNLNCFFEKRTFLMLWSIFEAYKKYTEERSRIRKLFLSLIPLPAPGTTWQSSGGLCRFSGRRNTVWESFHCGNCRKDAGLCGSPTLSSFLQINFTH